jgi:hypothetical protein
MFHNIMTSTSFSNVMACTLYNYLCFAGAGYVRLQVKYNLYSYRSFAIIILKFVTFSLCACEIYIFLGNRTMKIQNCIVEIISQLYMPSGSAS